VRTTLALIALGIASLAPADRLLNVPTGKKIPFETVRLDLETDFARGAGWRGYLGVGLGPSFDAAVRSEQMPGLPNRFAFDFSYNFVEPIVVDGPPGISVGVLDLLDEAQDGRRFFLSATYRTGAELEIPIETTIGGYFGHRQGVMVGVRFPLGDDFRFLIEHDGVRINSGFELRLGPDLALRLYARGQETLVGLSSRSRF
jgi:hypothetical protein